MFEINLESHCIKWLSLLIADCKVDCMKVLSNQSKTTAIISISIRIISVRPSNIDSLIIMK